jgi:DNA (cytosine-5)-methyltransferase 1
MYTVLDLFSGIGGFGLACRWLDLETVAFCEIDPFCQSILRKHWPNVPIFDDVKSLKFHAPGAYLHDGKQHAETGPIDIICGGFPCQDTSTAGAANGPRKGLGGDRSGLWFEYLRLIEECRPELVIVENPEGVAAWADTIVGGLEAVGYHVTIRKCASSDFGAPHQRRRLFFIANAGGYRLETWRKPNRGKDGREKTYVGCSVAGSYRGTAKSENVGVDARLSRRLDKARVKALGNTVDPRVAAYVLNYAVETYLGTS